MIFRLWPTVKYSAFLLTCFTLASPQTRSLSDELERRSELEKVGGLVYLSDLHTGGLERSDIGPGCRFSGVRLASIQSAT
jgi:hypothetical protein